MKCEKCNSENCIKKGLRNNLHSTHYLKPQQKGSNIGETQWNKTLWKLEDKKDIQKMDILFLFVKFNENSFCLLKGFSELGYK